MDPPRNRKQRRAAAAAAAPTDDDSAFDPSSIPLAHPSQDPSTKIKGKTLVELISERQSQLLGQGQKSGGTDNLTPAPGTRFVTVDPTTGEISGFDGSSPPGGKEPSEAPSGDNEAASEEEEDYLEHPIPPFIDTVLLSLPLSTLHLTLAYLAAHQYAERIELDKLIRESAFVAFPMLTFLIHLAHGHIVTLYGGGGSETVSLFPWSRDKLSLSFLRKLLFPPSLRTMTFLPLAITLGTKLIINTNEEAYYAVMKRAPAIGTLWIWSILEIPLGAALLGALGPLAWGVFWKGYGII